MSTSLEFLTPELISALGGAIIGALVTGLLSMFQQRRQNQITLTIQLYQEYEASNMAKLRTRVRPLFEKCLDQEPPISIEQIRVMKPGQLQRIGANSSFNDVHILFHFFERVSVLYLGGHLEKKLFLETIGKSFFIYYNKYIAEFINIAVERKEPARRWMKPIKRLADEVKKFKVTKEWESSFDVEASPILYSEQKR